MWRYSVLVIFLLLTSGVARAQFVLNPSDGLPDLGRSSVAWADFNNDGKLDVAISGINSFGTMEAGIYFNNNDDTFSNSGASLTPLSDGDMAVQDFNQDGYIDLLMTGIDAKDTKVSTLYKNSGSGIFTSLPIAFEGVANGGVAFADLNNDGKPDILLNGLNNLNNGITLYYVNNGNETFSIKSTTFEGTSYGDLLIADFNNDSFSDVMLTGLDNNNQRITSLYINRGGNSFAIQGTTLPALRSGGLSATDVNNDGYVDLLISGNGVGDINLTHVYRNNSGAGFVLLKSLPAVADGGGAWGDFNHDGVTDLGMFGFDKIDPQAFIFKSSGNTWVDSGFPLPGNSKGACAWVDYNNDNRLDFFLGGYSTVPFSSIYTNTSSGVNVAPMAPANLRYTAYADSVVLSWDASTDLETSSSGLTYSVYIGSSSGAMDVMASLANRSTGLRKTTGPGEVQHTSLVIKGLREGKYYWAVQAIDPAFGASFFSAEGTFVSCTPPSITGLNKICFNSTLVLNAGNASDVVQWYLKGNSNLVGTGNELKKIVKTKETFIAKVTKALGCMVYDTLVVDVLPLPQVDAGKDVMHCLLEEVVLNAVTSESKIIWYEKGNEAKILFSQKDILLTHTNEIELVVRVEDAQTCLNRDTVKIKLFPQPFINLGSDHQVCPGTDISWFVGSVARSVSWYSKAKGLLLQDNASLTIKANQPDKIWASVMSVDKCVSTDTVDITIFSLPLAAAGDDKMICENKGVSIGVPDPGELTFQWQPSSSLSDANVVNPIASPKADTQYVLTVTDKNNCSNRDTMLVYLNRPTTVHIGSDVAICVGDKVRLGGKPTASGSTLPYTFVWFPEKGLDDAASSNPTVSPLETTTYSLKTMAGECLANISAVTITVNPLPRVNAGDDLIVGAGQSTTLSVEGAIDYHWYPEEFFLDYTAPRTIISPNHTLRYWVVGKDSNGCYNSDTVQVSIRSELFVPSLFTPNGDGSNDIFRVHGFGIEEIVLKVFDRWGRLLFESNNMNEGWDGTLHGNEIESDSFVWTVEGFFFDGTTLEYKGQRRGIVRLLR